MRTLLPQYNEVSQQQMVTSRPHRPLTRYTFDLTMLIHLFLSLSVKLTLFLLRSSLALKIAKTLYLPSKPQREPK